MQCLFWDESIQQDAVAALQRSIGELVRYRNLVESTYSIVYEHDLEGRFLTLNAEGQRITGYSEADICRLRIEDVVAPEHVQLARDQIDLKLKQPAPESGSVPYELEILTKEGLRIPVEITSRVVYREGIPQKIEGHARDIREKRRLEQERLKEIHHRVKNNLQIISSLLSLESDKASEERAARLVELARANPSQATALVQRTMEQVRQAFEACESRVQAMAMIHKTLYESQDTAKIDLADYVKRLGKYLQQSSEAVTVRYNLDQDVRVGLETAVPCGLVINELVANSLKHAFPSGRRGEVRIGLHTVSANDGLYLLVVGDNGIGMPRDFDPAGCDSLGMRLVYGLVEKQLQGEIELSRAHGTTFSINFHDVSRSLR